MHSFLFRSTGDEKQAVDNLIWRFHSKERQNQQQQILCYNVNPKSDCNNFVWNGPKWHFKIQCEYFLGNLFLVNKRKEKKNRKKYKTIPKTATILILSHIPNLSTGQYNSFGISRISLCDLIALLRGNTHGNSHTQKPTMKMFLGRVNCNSVIHKPNICDKRIIKDFRFKFEYLALSFHLEWKKTSEDK